MVIPSLHLEALTLLVVLYSTQSGSLTSVPKAGIKSLMKNSRVIIAVSKLAVEYQVSAFYGPLVESLLLEMSQETNAAHLEKASVFLRNSVEEISFKGSDSIAIIK